MYRLYWKVSRYAIFLWKETFGEKNTQGVTHLWMCGRFSTVVWGICCKTLCGDLWGLILIFRSFVEGPSLATFYHSCLIFFKYFCNNFDLIPELSLPRNLFLMSQSMEIKNFRFWGNTAIKSVDHFIWNFEGLVQVSFRGIPVQFCFWYSGQSRPMTIPHICHESHENSRVNFFWPVSIFTDLTRKIGNLQCILP